MILEGTRQASNNRHGQSATSLNKANSNENKQPDVKSTSSIREGKLDALVNIRDSSPREKKNQSVTFLEKPLFEMKAVIDTNSKPSGSASARDLRTRIEKR
jgi:hypothetical protein